MKLLDNRLERNTLRGIVSTLNGWGLPGLHATLARGRHGVLRADVALSSPRSGTIGLGVYRLAVRDTDKQLEREVVLVAAQKELASVRMSLLGPSSKEIRQMANVVQGHALQEASVSMLRSFETLLHVPLSERVMGCVHEASTGASGIAAVNDRKQAVELSLGVRQRNVTWPSLQYNLRLKVDHRTVRDTPIDGFDDGLLNCNDLIGTLKHNTTIVREQEVDLAQLQGYLALDTAKIPGVGIREPTEAEARKLVGACLVIQMEGSQAYIRSSGRDMPYILEATGGEFPSLTAAEKLGEVAKKLQGLTPTRVAAKIAAHQAHILDNQSPETNLESSLDLA